MEQRVRLEAAVVSSHSGCCSSSLQGAPRLQPFIDERVSSSLPPREIMDLKDSQTAGHRPGQPTLTHFS